MMNKLLISICSVILLTDIHTTASEDNSSTCNAPLTCLSSTACVNLHGGRGNLYNGIIFRCGGGLPGNENVCCPPVVPPPRKKKPTPTPTPHHRPPTPPHRPPTKPIATQIGNRTTNDNLLHHKNMGLLPVSQCGTQTADRVSNGQEANLGQFPWMALLGYLGASPNITMISFLCGGSLITNRYVLTAAHCVDTSEKNLELKVVRLGELDLNTNPDCADYCADEYVDFEVARVTTHAEYIPRTLKHDIALVRLKTTVAKFTSYIRPICLPFNFAHITGAEEEKFRVAGWGKLDWKQEEGSTSLQWATVTSLSIEECNAVHKTAGDRMLTNTQLCAAGGAGEDACKGDSGGPLMHTKKGETTAAQVGIVSFAFRDCGTQGIPSIYTRVSSYLRWTLDNISS